LKSNLRDLCYAFYPILELTNFSRLEEFKNQLVIALERGNNKFVALDFAERYRAEELLCRLVFDIGQPAY